MIFIPGCAGFIGFSTTLTLLEQGNTCVGIDNLNRYYDVKMKQKRLSILKGYKNFIFYEADVENFDTLKLIFQLHRFDSIINLAARAGVRYSMQNPFVYLSTNTLGALNLFELAKHFGVEKVVLASTSSLYAGEPLPFREDYPVNKPLSVYAASKKAMEAIAYSYYQLYGIDVTMLRYFTVYGPYGRPDMSIFRFIKWIYEEEPVVIFGDGSQSRDFTYIDDAVDATIKGLKKVGCEAFNVGANTSYSLNYIISLIEQNLGKKAKIVHKEFHKADVLATRADFSKINSLLGFKPKVTIEEGIKRLCDWYVENASFLKDISTKEQDR
ncbi:GDP-mannose 4,6-dehydratase [Desulfurella sp.]|uniref:GDP-mannose 4,6-dehydratase n=1 Tax=Desulfurella sp. TaxID=1962857 RepID=UPI0025B961FF|nr:GDP-mannose 4,6-dehydratase [Desulfurella sp.]